MQMKAALGLSNSRAGLDPQTRRTVEGLFVGLFLGALCWGVLIGIAFTVLS
jgi:hypothetical protein